jgi:hypothetical protein
MVIGRVIVCFCARQPQDAAQRWAGLYMGLAELLEIKQLQVEVYRQECLCHSENPRCRPYPPELRASGAALRNRADTNAAAAQLRGRGDLSAARVNAIDGESGLGQKRSVRYAEDARGDACRGASATARDTFVWGQD